MDLQVSPPSTNSGDTSQSGTASPPPASVRPNLNNNQADSELSAAAIYRLLNSASVDSAPERTTWSDKLTSYHDTLNHVERSVKPIRLALRFSIMSGSVKRLFLTLSPLHNEHEPTLHNEHERTKIIQINKVWQRIMDQPANNFQSPADLLFALEEHQQAPSKKNGAKKKTSTQNGGQQWKHDHHRCEIKSLARFFCVEKKGEKEMLLHLTKEGFTGLQQLDISFDEIKIIASLVMTTNARESSDYTFLLDIFSKAPSLLNKKELSAWITAAFDKGRPDNLRAKHIELFSAWLSSIHPQLLQHKHGLLPKKLVQEIDDAGPIIVRLSQIDELDGDTLSLLADWKAITLFDPLELELRSSEEICKRISDLDASNLLHYKALASVLKYVRDKQTTKTTPSSSSRPARSQSRPSEVSDNSKKSTEQEDDALLEQAIKQKLVSCNIIPQRLSPEEYFLLLTIAFEQKKVPFLIDWLKAYPIDQPIPDSYKPTVDKLITMLLERIVNEQEIQQQLLYLKILNCIGKWAKPEQMTALPLTMFKSWKLLFPNTTTRYNAREYQKSRQISNLWEQIIARLPNKYKPLVGLLFAFEQCQQPSSGDTQNVQQQWKCDQHGCEIRFMAKWLSLSQKGDRENVSLLTKESLAHLKQLGVSANEIQAIASLVMTTDPQEASGCNFLLDLFNDNSSLLNKEELLAYLTRVFDRNASDEVHSKSIQILSRWLSTLYRKLSTHNKHEALSEALLNEIRSLDPFVNRLSKMEGLNSETRSLLAEWETVTLFDPLKLRRLSIAELHTRIINLNISKPLHLRALLSALKQTLTPQTCEEFFSTFSDNLTPSPLNAEKLAVFREVAEHIANLTQTLPHFFTQLLHKFVAIKQQIKPSSETNSTQEFTALCHSFNKLRRWFNQLFDSIVLKGRQGNANNFDAFHSYEFLKHLDLELVMQKLLLSQEEEIWTPMLDDSITYLVLSFYNRSREKGEDLTQTPIFCPFIQTLILSFPKHLPQAKAIHWMNIGDIISFVRTFAERSSNTSHPYALLDAKSGPIFLDMVCYFFQQHEKQIDEASQAESITIFQAWLNSFENCADFFYLVKSEENIPNFNHKKTLEILKLFASSDAKCMKLIIRIGTDPISNISSSISSESLALLNYPEATPTKVLLGQWTNTLDKIRISATIWIGGYLYRHWNQEIFFSYFFQYIQDLPPHPQTTNELSRLFDTMGPGRQLAKLLVFSLQNINQLTRLISIFKERIAHSTAEEHFFFWSNLYHEWHIRIQDKSMKEKELNPEIPAINRETIERFLIEQLRQLALDTVQKRIQTARETPDSKEGEKKTLLTDFSNMVQYIATHNIAIPSSARIFVYSLLSAHLDLFARKASRPPQQGELSSCHQDHNVDSRTFLCRCHVTSSQ
ncbi:hypothetical protein JYU14_01425 [Simkania negevensis]|uniref:Uncharacterized protein n=1 Tax=Simkania negevensis TaxID=83561 RepID=A0ABS3APV5_9BACT|nr:hypothetical protein [Simkania negevensis]